MRAKTLRRSALLVKGKTIVAAQNRSLHFQISASGWNELGDESEAELFKKIPTLEHVNELLRADDTHVVLRCAVSFFGGITDQEGRGAPRLRPCSRQ